MRFNRSLIYYATLGTSLLCFNLETIASTQPSGPFDIPLKAASLENNTDGEVVRHLRTTHKQQHEDFINELNESVSHKSIPLTEEEKSDIRKNRTERMQERRAKAKKVIMEHQPDVGQLERMSNDEIRKVYGNAIKEDPNLEKEDNRWMRNLGRQLTRTTEDYPVMADPGEYYGKKGIVANLSFLVYFCTWNSNVFCFKSSIEKWAQGYRMLGGYIDCDNGKDGGGSHDNKNNGGGNNMKCSRWMMWAAVSFILLHILIL